MGCSEDRKNTIVIVIGQLVVVSLFIIVCVEYANEKAEYENLRDLPQLACKVKAVHEFVGNPHRALLTLYILQNPKLLDIVAECDPQTSCQTQFPVNGTLHCWYHYEQLQLTPVDTSKLKLNMTMHIILMVALVLILLSLCSFWIFAIQLWWWERQARIRTESELPPPTATGSENSENASIPLVSTHVPSEAENSV